MRRCVTLVELMLVLAVAGILFGVAVPALSLLLDSLAVHAAISHIEAAHARARLLAITRGKVITLAIDSARIAISPRNDTLALWSEEGPSAQRVHLEGAQRQFTFSPEGFTLEFPMPPSSSPGEPLAKPLSSPGWEEFGCCLEGRTIRGRWPLDAVGRPGGR